MCDAEPAAGAVACDLAIIGIRKFEYAGVIAHHLFGLERAGLELVAQGNEEVIITMIYP